MPLVGFEPTISAGEQPKTYALDRAVTQTGIYIYIYIYIYICMYIILLDEKRLILSSTNIQSPAI